MTVDVPNTNGTVNTFYHFGTLNKKYGKSQKKYLGGLKGQGKGQAIQKICFFGFVALYV